MTALQSPTGKYSGLQGNSCNENRIPAIEYRVPCNENRFFPVRIDLQGVPCKPYTVWVCSGVMTWDFTSTTSVGTQVLVRASQNYTRSRSSIRMGLWINFIFSNLRSYILRRTQKIESFSENMNFTNQPCFLVTVEQSSMKAKEMHENSRKKRSTRP